MTRYSADGSRLRRPVLSDTQCFNIAWEFAKLYVEQVHSVDRLRIGGKFAHHQTDADHAEDIARFERYAAEHLAVVVRVTSPGDAPKWIMRHADLARVQWRHDVADWTRCAERRRQREERAAA